MLPIFHLTWLIDQLPCESKILQLLVVLKPLANAAQCHLSLNQLAWIFVNILLQVLLFGQYIRGYANQIGLWVPWILSFALDPSLISHSCAPVFMLLQAREVDSLCSFWETLTIFNLILGNAYPKSQQQGLLIAQFCSYVEWALLQVIQYRNFGPKAMAMPQWLIHCCLNDLLYLFQGKIELVSGHSRPA